MSDVMVNINNHVLFLATGGTIAGRTPAGKSGTYESGSVNISGLLAASGVACGQNDVDSEDLSAVGSQDMSEDIWSRLHSRITRALLHEKYQTIIVTHGTDTLEETAFLLDLTLPPVGTVVLAGAMRPADAPGADGPRVILNALQIARAAMHQARGILTLSGDTLFSPRTVYKAYTSGTEGMRAWPGGACGTVTHGGIRFYTGPLRDTYSGFFPMPVPGRWPRVTVIFVTACMDSPSVEAVLSTRPAGIILAGVGHGNAPEWLLEMLTDYSRSGGIVIRSTRLNEGAVTRNLEVDDDNRGFISAGYQSPQRSRILLQLILQNNSHELAEIQQIFDDISL